MVECIIGFVALAIILSNSLKTAPPQEDPAPCATHTVSLSKPKPSPVPAELTAQEKDKIMADRIYEKSIDGTIKWKHFVNGYEVTHYQGYRFFMSRFGRLEITGPNGDVVLQEHNRWAEFYAKSTLMRDAQKRVKERSAEDRFRDSAFEKLGS